MEPSLIVGSECVTRSPEKCDTLLEPPVKAQVKGGGKLPTNTGQVGDLFFGVPDFVGDLAADRPFCPVLEVLSGSPGVFGLVGEGGGAASFQVRLLRARRSRRWVPSC